MPRTDCLKRIFFVLVLPLANTLAYAQDLSEPDGAVAKAFTAFWTSTDCAQMKALSDWPRMMAKTDSNDKDLCESLVALHQFVQKVDVVDVQSLPGNRAKVKATITLMTQASMKQEDTFAQVDGKWLLSPP